MVKFNDSVAFADSIFTFRVLPAQMINIVALTLPPLEIFLGGMLIAGFRMRPVLLGLGLLTGIFLLALLQALIRGVPVDCGCFGSGEPSLWGTWKTFGRDVILFAALLLLYVQAFTSAQE